MKTIVSNIVCNSFIWLLSGIFILCSCGKSKDKDDSQSDLLSETQSEEIVEDGREVTVQLKPSNYVRSIRVRNIGPLRQVFNDSNYLQLEAAQRLGIEPVSDLSSAYFMKRPLVKVSSNQYYHIDSLRHSIPYLVPEAASLLEEI